MARLKDMYSKEVAPALMNKFAYRSPMQVPRFDKIVINIGAGDAKENAKVIDTIIADLSTYHRSEGSAELRKEVGC